MKSSFQEFKLGVPSGNCVLTCACECVRVHNMLVQKAENHQHESPPEKCTTATENALNLRHSLMCTSRDVTAGSAQPATCSVLVHFLIYHSENNNHN